MWLSRTSGVPAPSSHAQGSCGDRQSGLRAPPQPWRPDSAQACGGGGGGALSRQGLGQDGSGLPLLGPKS